MVTLNELPKAGAGKILIREYGTEELKYELQDAMGFITKERSPLVIGDVVDVCPTLYRSGILVGDKVYVPRTSRSIDRIFIYNGEEYSIVTDPRMVNYLVKRARFRLLRQLVCWIKDLFKKLFDAEKED